MPCDNSVTDSRRISGPQGIHHPVTRTGLKSQIAEGRVAILPWRYYGRTVANGVSGRKRRGRTGEKAKGGHEVARSER